MYFNKTSNICLNQHKHFVQETKKFKMNKYLRIRNVKIQVENNKIEKSAKANSPILAVAASGW